MMPDHELSSQVMKGTYLAPDGGDRVSSTTDLEKGGIAIADPSQGLQVQVWQLTYENSQFIVTPQSFGDPVPGPIIYGVTEASLAFDQNMNVFITYVVEGQAWYFWYDPIALEYVHQIMTTDVENPRCCMDDKRIAMVDTSDIILAYTRNNNLYYREQRDRYTVEYPLATGVEGRLEAVGMNKNYRLQFMFLTASPPTPPVPPLNALELIKNGSETGWIDLTNFSNTTFEDVFGVPVSGADFIQVINRMGENIAVTAPNANIELRIVDSIDASEVIILRCATNGNVNGSLHYINSPHDPSVHLPLQDGVDTILLIGSDTGWAKIQKDDTT